MGWGVWKKQPSWQISSRSRMRCHKGKCVIWFCPQMDLTFTLLVSQRDYSVHGVCVSVCGSVRNPDRALHTTVSIRLFWNFTYMFDVECSLCTIIFRILGQRSTKGKKRVFGHILETTFWHFWHFGLWPIVSKIAPGQNSDPPLKMRRIAFFAVSVYIRLHISVICNPIV